MGTGLVSLLILQFACAYCAAKFGRPAVWLRVILLVPLFGSLAYCGFEIRRRLARPVPLAQTASTPLSEQTQPTLGWLGYQAVRARTAEGRRALAEECLRIGRHADARLLFESCMKGPAAQDPRLIAGLKRATAQMDKPVFPAANPGGRGATILP